MNCKELCLLLSDYFEGELDPKICEVIDTHVKECQCCEFIFNTFMKTVDLCKEVKSEKVPVEIHRKIIQIIDMKIDINDD